MLVTVKAVVSNITATVMVDPVRAVVAVASSSVLATGSLVVARRAEVEARIAVTNTYAWKETPQSSDHRFAQCPMPAVKLSSPSGI